MKFSSDRELRFQMTKLNINCEQKVTESDKNDNKITK